MKNYFSVVPTTGKTSAQHFFRATENHFSCQQAF
jgi:hypothetical protein